MQGVQAPRQARSQRTFDNLLDAAEDLLNEKSFLEISINEIVSRAGSSVGSFYARFDDKTRAKIAEALSDIGVDRFVLCDANNSVWIENASRGRLRACRAAIESRKMSLADHLADLYDQLNPA